MKPLLLSFVWAVTYYVAISQGSSTNHIDLAKEFANGHLRVINRSLTVINRDSGSVYLDAKPVMGTAWLDQIHFSQGIIEFDIRGRNLLQQSFVGLAFNRQNDSTFEVAYFRPFNFHSPDSFRRTHCVQYMSLPDNGWNKLRTQFPARYEQPVHPVPNPEDWFHTKLVITATTVEVFVENSQTPSLVVTRLAKPGMGSIGLWVDYASEGSFANLVLTPVK